MAKLPSEFRSSFGRHAVGRSPSAPIRADPIGGPTGGPEEKQACRNFVAALMMARCGARTVRAMQGAFRGDTAAKMLALYVDIGNGRQNDGLAIETAMRLEDQASSHMAHIGALKAAIDLAATGQPGAALDPFNGNFGADAINGPDILDDLVNQAAP